MSAALGDGGPGERCNYEWAAEGSRKDVGQVHDVGLHGASAGLDGRAQGPDALGTGEEGHGSGEQQQQQQAS